MKSNRLTNRSEITARSGRPAVAGTAMCVLLAIAILSGCGGDDRPRRLSTSQEPEKATSTTPTPTPSPSTPTPSTQQPKSPGMPGGVTLLGNDLDSDRKTEPKAEPKKEKKPEPKEEPKVEPKEEKKIEKKAQVGVGKKGRGYGKGVIVTPVATLFAVRERLVFTVQIPQAMDLFKAEQGRAPKDNDEFMAEIIKKNNIKLPQLPDGDRYMYYPKTQELMVESPAPE